MSLDIQLTLADFRSNFFHIKCPQFRYHLCNILYRILYFAMYFYYVLPRILLSRKISSESTFTCQ